MVDGMSFFSHLSETCSALTKMSCRSASFFYIPSIIKVGVGISEDNNGLTDEQT
jgi:hypothetical protein